MLRFAVVRASFLITVIAVIDGALPIAARANTDTWDGGGFNNNFSNAENWVGDVAPLPNDVLVFDGAIRPTPNNDYSTDTPFNGITFASTVAGPFVVTGNEINLNGDINDNTQAFVNTLSLPLALQLTPNVSVTANGSLAITSVISGAGFGLNQTGNGTLILSGTNTFTGPINVTGGTLAIGTTAITPNANLGGSTSLTINGGSTLLIGIPSTQTTALNTTLSAARGIQIGPSSGSGTSIISILNNPNTNGSVASQQTVTYDGVISNNGSGVGGLTKIGFGNLVLGGTNTYTGPTTIGTGNLTVDFTQVGAPTTNIINPASSLIMGGFNAGQGAVNYATLIETGSAANNSSQTFNGTTINVGNAIVQATIGSGHSATISLGAITPSGGTLTFVQPASGSITTTTANTNGILGGWATSGAAGTPTVQTLNSVTVTQGNAFATNDGTGKIIAYTGYNQISGSATLTGGSGSAGAIGASSNVQLKFSGSSYSVATGSGQANNTLDVNTISYIGTSGASVFGSVFIGAGNTLRLGQYGAIMRQDNNTNGTVFVIGNNDTNTTTINNAESGSQDVGTLTAGGAEYGRSDCFQH